PAESCDQMYVMGVDGAGLHRVSSGRGRTTCGYFFDRDRRIFYSSTEHAGAACPPRPDYSQGYVWALYDYDLYTAAADGSGARRLVRPTRMDLWVMKADGSGQRQVTQLPGASFAPSFFPDSRRIIFASNYPSPTSEHFDLYAVNVDGTGLERITTDNTFNAFPMFSPDGRRLVWASTSHGQVAYEGYI